MADDTDKEDKGLFRATVKGVRRLRQQQVVPHRNRIQPVPRKNLHDKTQMRENPLTYDYAPSEVEQLGDDLLFVRPGLQHTVVRKLRRGQFIVSDELDLHGMTVPIAHRALNDFLARCQAADTRCVRVIHGKGLSTPDRPPVLKSRVNTWLKQYRDVLAFCSARAQDGGTGALYVLLKRNR